MPQLPKRTWQRGSSGLARTATAAWLLAILLILPGCGSSPSGDIALEEGVTVRDLQDPPSDVTLDDLLGDSGGALAMASPGQGTQPVVDLTGQAQQPAPPEAPSAYTPAGPSGAGGTSGADQRVLQPGEDGEVELPELPDHARPDTNPDGQIELDVHPDTTGADERATSAAPEPPRPPRRVSVRKMVFHHPDPRVSRAMDMLERSLPEDEQRMWRDNGFFVGQLDRDRLPMFMANLPRELSIDVSNLRRVDRYWPLTLIDRLHGPQYIELMNGDGPPDQQRLVGGRFQMLIKLVPDFDRDQRGIYLDMLPHHRGVQAELIPRSPGERVLDGTSFQDLRLYQPISTQKVWVVAADLPLEVDDGEDEDEQETAEAEADRTRPEPAKLGQAMMQGEHRGRQVQMLLLILAD